MPFTRALELGRPHPGASSVADADGITAEPVASHRGRSCFQWTGRVVRGSCDEAASEANGRGAGRPEARDAEEASLLSSPGGALTLLRTADSEASVHTRSWVAAFLEERLPISGSCN